MNINSFFRISIYALIFIVFAYTSFAEDPAGDLVTLDYKNADLANVLRSISYSYDLNLVATKDIKGEVTVSLRGVTIDEALKAILSVNGYTFTKKNNVIYITPGPGLEGIDMVTATVPLKYIPAPEAATLLQATVSPRGDIRVNDSTNSLVVTDFPTFIEKVRNVIAEVDIPPIQVLIEAKLVDITEADRFNFGSSISFSYDPINGMFGRDTDVDESMSYTTSVSGPSATLDTGQLQLTAFTLKDFQATATIDALMEDNRAHLLASPSIATLNGREARIIIGERYPYKEKTQTTTGTTETTKFVDIGTTLRVTPLVSSDGWITMIVHPEVSSLAAELDAGPRITTREADATIRVRDGQTIVIGGLIKRQDDRTNGEVPILGRIPILGILFSNRSKDVSVTELVVFITPRIIRSEEELGTVKFTRKEEVRVNIEGVGERVIVSQLWGEIYDLEQNKGAMSYAKDRETRMAEALDRCKQIASQFPGHEKADDALYKGGRIAYTYFKDMELARSLFEKLVTNYPDSPYNNKSKWMIKVIDRKKK